MTTIENFMNTGRLLNTTLSFLDVKNLANIGLVCKKWRHPSLAKILEIYYTRLEQFAHKLNKSIACQKKTHIFRANFPLLTFSNFKVSLAFTKQLLIKDLHANGYSKKDIEYVLKKRNFPNVKTNKSIDTIIKHSFENDTIIYSTAIFSFIKEFAPKHLIITSLEIGKKLIKKQEYDLALDYLIQALNCPNEITILNNAEGVFDEINSLIFKIFEKIYETYHNDIFEALLSINSHACKVTHKLEWDTSGASLIRKIESKLIDVETWENQSINDILDNIAHPSLRSILIKKIIQYFCQKDSIPELKTFLGTISNNKLKKNILKKIELHIREVEYAKAIQLAALIENPQIKNVIYTELIDRCIHEKKYKQAALLCPKLQNQASERLTIISHYYDTVYGQFISQLHKHGLINVETLEELLDLPNYNYKSRALLKVAAHFLGKNFILTSLKYGLQIENSEELTRYINELERISNYQTLISLMRSITTNQEVVIGDDLFDTIKVLNRTPNHLEAKSNLLYKLSTKLLVDNLTDISIGLAKNIFYDRYRIKALHQIFDYLFDEHNVDINKAREVLDLIDNFSCPEEYLSHVKKLSNKVNRQVLFKDMLSFSLFKIVLSQPHLSVKALEIANSIIDNQLKQELFEIVQVSLVNRTASNWKLEILSQYFSKELLNMSSDNLDVKLTDFYYIKDFIVNDSDCYDEPNEKNNENIPEEKFRENELDPHKSSAEIEVLLKALNFNDATLAANKINNRLAKSQALYKILEKLIAQKELSQAIMIADQIPETHLRDLANDLIAKSF